jgi:hypothetical protein
MVDTALFFKARHVQHTEIEEVSSPLASTFFSQYVGPLAVPMSNREPALMRVQRDSHLK